MEADRSGDAYERRRHVRRLERAMAEARVWPVDRFRSEVMSHPERGALAERVLWMSRGAFRVQDGTPVDVEGEPTVLASTVSVAHAAELPPEELRSWGEHFAVRHLRSPFDQLSRPARLSDEGASLEPLGVDALDEVSLRTVLEPRGWALGEPDQGLRVRHLIRRFGDEDPVAVLMIEPGLARGRPELQRVQRAVFETAQPGGLSAGDGALPLADVPRRVRSEVLYDLSLLPT